MKKENSQSSQDSTEKTDDDDYQTAIDTDHQLFQTYTKDCIRWHQISVTRWNCNTKPEYWTWKCCVSGEKRKNVKSK